MAFDHDPRGPWRFPRPPSTLLPAIGRHKLDQLGLARRTPTQQRIEQSAVARLTKPRADLSEAGA